MALWVTNGNVKYKGVRNGCGWKSLWILGAEVSCTYRRNLPQQLNRQFPLDKSNQEGRNTSEKIQAFPTSEPTDFHSKCSTAEGPRQGSQGRESFLRGAWKGSYSSQKTGEGNNNVSVGVLDSRGAVIWGKNVKVHFFFLPQVNGKNMLLLRNPHLHRGHGNTIPAVASLLKFPFPPSSRSSDSSGLISNLSLLSYCLTHRFYSLILGQYLTYCSFSSRLCLWLHVLRMHFLSPRIVLG